MTMPRTSADRAMHAPTAATAEAAAPAIRAVLHVAADTGDAGLRIAGVTLYNGRPLAVGRLLEARPADEATRLLTLLLNLCGQAQALAFRLAVNAAVTDDERAITPASEPRMNAALATVRVEALREHALSLFHHWPALLGMRPPEALPVLLQTAMQLMKAPENEEVRARLAGQWMALLHAHLMPLVERMLALSLPPAPEMAPPEDEDWPFLAIRLLTDGTGRQVRLPVDAKGQPAHVLPRPADMREEHAAGRTDRPDEAPIASAVAQLTRAGLWPMAVRLAHLQALLAWLRDGTPLDDAIAAGLGPHRGMARVLTARGWLLHAVDTAAQRGKTQDIERDTGPVVRRCALLAPTEWHCHPQGLAARWLAALRARSLERLRRQAMAVMRLVDPCEAFDVTIVEESGHGDPVRRPNGKGDTREAEAHA